ncbi:MAG: SRPBCC family protein [Myxococcota bacterium]|nr:SRPBCC family protein [Myxococcota bacterium]
MPEVHLQREFPVGAAELWPWVTEPERMSRWSLAPVSLLAPGPDGAATSVGSRRRVVVPIGLFKMPLEEVIVLCDPPRAHHYRVVAGGSLRDHLGRLELSPLDGGTRLSWQVRFGSRPAFLGSTIRALLLPRLERSLDQLDAVLRGDQAG